MLSAHVQNTTIVSLCLFLFTLMGILIVFLWVILLLRFSINEYLLFLYAYFTHTRMLSGALSLLNPYNAELILYKPWRPKGFNNLKAS